MKIIALDAENVKRLKAVHIEPDGSLVIIGGRNAQGKTSVLDSIMYALGGKKALPPKPLRDGAEHGHVTLDLEDLKVTRTFTAGGGGELRVEAQGALFRSPQAMLDKLVGKLGFDPMAFDSMEPAKRLEQLKNLVGLDFTGLETQRKKLYEERAEVNRDRKSTEGTLDSLEHTPDVPDIEISVADLTAQLQEATAVYRGADDVERRATELESKIPTLDEAIARTQDRIQEKLHEIDTLREEVARFEEDKARIPDEADSARCEAARIREQHEDPDTIRQRLEQSQTTNAAVRTNQEIAELEQLLRSQEERAGRLTDQIKAIDDDKQKQLNAASFPVDGLGFGEGEVTFNDQPWEQCAQSERIRVSVAMGFAMNPKLRVLLIREGSGLDEDALRLVAELAEEAKGQLFIERVGDKDESAIIIEDGMVQGAERSESDEQQTEDRV